MRVGLEEVLGRGGLLEEGGGGSATAVMGGFRILGQRRGPGSTGTGHIGL